MEWDWPRVSRYLRTNVGELGALRRAELEGEAKVGRLEAILHDIELAGLELQATTERIRQGKARFDDAARDANEAKRLRGDAEARKDEAARQIHDAGAHARANDAKAILEHLRELQQVSKAARVRLEERFAEVNAIRASVGLPALDLPKRQPKPGPQPTATEPEEPRFSHQDRVTCASMMR